jgi:hypothetical protein
MFIFFKKIHPEKKLIFSLPKIVGSSCFVISGCLISMVLFSKSSLSQTWTQNSLTSFAKGTLDASGQNLYINSKGQLRTIHRFDLNSDGNIDLLFNSTHDYDYDVPATIMSLTKDRKMTVGNLAVTGSLSVQVPDLNKDGFPDLVFCPNSSGLQTSRGMVTIIWGGKDGWPSYRSNGLLPINGAKSVVVADMNKDDWPDIVTLNSEAWNPGQPEGNIVRIYWGGSYGFMLNSFKDVGIKKASSLLSCDFDSDGFKDVALLTGSTVKILWATKIKDSASKTDASKIFDFSEIQLPDDKGTCFTEGDIDGDWHSDIVIGCPEKLYVINGKEARGGNSIKTIPIKANATSISVGDIDKDGSADIIISSSLLNPQSGESMGESKTVNSNSMILWGNKGNFSSGQTTELIAPYSVSTAIADIDGDGRQDIICAIERGEKTYTAESKIFFGKGSRTFEQSKKGIPSSGAYDIAVIPPDKTGTSHVIICNRMKGTLDEKVPLYLYWGSEEGFNEENKTLIPFASGYQSLAADINEDGYVDIVSMNSMHGGGEKGATAGANIFWGSKDGFDFRNNRTVLNEENASTCNIADLNHDGYLDIVIGFFEHQDMKPTDLVIYYGSKSGFDSRNRVAIPCDGRSASPTIADYNKDGWLDIAVCSYPKDILRIFWGSAEGFNEKNHQNIYVPSIIDLETADFNKDGYLDLVACSYNDKVNHHHDTGVELLWGGPNGFEQWNSQWLPGFTPLGPVVSDFDGDGYLDLFCPSYLGDITREDLPMNLYWGGADGFNVERKTVLIGNSGTDGLAADFNKDGKMDLVVSSHTSNGAHSKGVSKVYYNDGKRFTSQSMVIKYLPSPGCHWMWNTDMGEIYNRKWEQVYTSDIFTWDKKRSGGTISYKAETLPGTEIRFEVHSSASKSLLSQAAWQPIESGNFKVNELSRCLQYRAIFISDNGDRYPVLDSVSVALK